MVNKIKSFIKLVKKELVAECELADKFDEFMASEYEDAYSYYASRALIRTQQITTRQLNFIIYNAMKTLNTNISDPRIVGEVMKMTGGKADPSFVREYINTFISENP